MTKPHVGKILHEVAKRHKLTIIQIVEDAGYKNQSIFYRHIAQPNLPFNILYKYARAMNYYFNRELPEFSIWLNQNSLVKESVGQLNYDELEKERDYWKDKYYALLEKYNSLLERN